VKGLVSKIFRRHPLTEEQLANQLERDRVRAEKLTTKSSRFGRTTPPAPPR